ncbi:GTP-binding protein [Zeaxanthinibacter sp. PT1]|uniref:sulfate adenylyltransferase subunit 1 n=1 Tax=Zeaxanthinibacter TaxID=561554 RepID=UPI00234B6168|nr:GTP-binding protein [Zeaxanthinibacter sp. PT1]MDC6352758.1 GTP-binding protein [Zeaxanthinibacter sp. PT1]
MEIHQNQLLRFTTAGSVDDGKSTLIGRLLYDSKSIFEDQMEAVENSSKKKGHNGIDLALFTDGLRDEREQGITIDVAYRYFTTPKRKFIIADTPGHIQYTRNMVTGASTANAAIVLIDARHGVIEQTKRHAFIANLLKIPHLIVCVNKMDLVNFDETAFTEIVSQFRSFSSKLEVTDTHFIPISALLGDNVVNPSEHMPWYDGGTLLHILETLEISNDVSQDDARFPVQTVLRPQREGYLDYRGYAGRISSGSFRVGDLVTVLPSGLSSTIASITGPGGEIEEAFAPMSVALTLKDDIDISRGDMIARTTNPPVPSQELEVMLCWLNKDAAKPRSKYTIKHTSNDQKAMIKEVLYKIDINKLEKKEDDHSLQMNDISKVRIKTTRPLMVDPYVKNRLTGSIILIDDATNETVAAGMIV